MKIKFAAMLLMGLMLATAFSGCTGEKDDTGGTGRTDGGTGDGTGGTGDTGTGGNQTDGSQTGNQTNVIFSDNFDDNKMDPLLKTADCDNDDRTKIEEKEGTMQIVAGGIDMQDDPQRGKCDEYVAVYYPKVNGDFEAIVKVVSLESETIVPENDNYYPGIWAKAGIMVRNDISASGSSTGYAIIAYSPNYWEFKADSDDNGYLNMGTPTEEKGTCPCWVKMVKEGTKFTGYYSTDGTNWKIVGNATLNSASASQDVGIFAHACTGVSGSPTGWPEPVYKLPLAIFDDFVIRG